ncbi:XkdF-like putative serine protease domain-containing protein [Streptomyces sp. NPDC102487]|uniref:XkdF-like putative serine protease domain-containing protein n=1 Tax=Streptomyces sp. NPDC102487 TaxID=3366182 RepID=UPI003818AFB4
MTPEQRYVLGVAYQAGPDPRIQRGMDGGRDYFTAEELEKAAWTFLPSGAQVGLFHGPDDTVGHATVVESYIWRAEPWDLGEGVTVRKGDWLIGAILDETAWALFKSGQVTGWSPQGTGRRLPAQPVATDPRARRSDAA